jgi:alpha-glucosidase
MNSRSFFTPFQCARWLSTLIVCASVGGVSLGATIGNVSSFSTSGQDVTFNIDDGSKVRLGILADDLAKVSIAPSGSFGANISQAVVMTSWPAASFSTTDNGSNVSITTSEMRLIVNKSPFTLECRDASNNLMVQDDPTRRIQWDSGRTEVYKQTQSGEQYLGLGWRTYGLVRNDTTFWMRNRPTYGDPTTFYSGVPLWYGMRNGQVYGIFFDDTSWGQIDVGDTSSSYMSFENIGGQLEYYYFAGPTMAQVLDRYTELTGRPYMPPRWSVGYQQCRWSYTPQSQVLDIANQFRVRSIPCDVIYLDIDYMPGGHQLMFNSSTFPTPPSMLSTLHGQGFKVVANISPFLFLDDPKYSTAASNGYLMKNAGGSIHTGWHDYWYFVGGAGTGSLAWIDFSRTTARNWWASQHTSFLNYGIDGIWNDLNEPDELGGAWPSDLKYNFDGQQINHEKTSTQFSLLQTQLSYSILANHYPNARPFVLSRGGYAGIQRYSTLWSGDNTSDWNNDFKRNIPMGLSMSISGNPHNGHDIGGFFGHPDFNDKPSNELYARWMQAGVFSPFCRQHHDGWGNHDPNRPFIEPWEFGTTVEDICRDWIGLHRSAISADALSVHTVLQRAYDRRADSAAGGV